MKLEELQENLKGSFELGRLRADGKALISDALEDYHYYGTLSKMNGIGVILHKWSSFGAVINPSAGHMGVSVEELGIVSGKELGTNKDILYLKFFDTETNSGICGGINRESVEGIRYQPSEAGKFCEVFSLSLVYPRGYAINIIGDRTWDLR